MARKAKGNPYGGKSKDPLAKLERRSRVTAKALAKSLGKSLAVIRGRIVAAETPAFARTQEELFADIATSFARFGRGLDKRLKDDVASAATDAAHRAKDASGGLVRWDESRARRYWRYVAPSQGKNLAAVFTDRMTDNLINTLRQSLVEVEREAAIEGMTANEKQKAVQERWAQTCRDSSAFKFVDSAGKVWENARYLQMLSRTTAQRVYNDSYADRLAEAGCEIARIVSMGAPGCKVCAAWQNQIVAVSGKSEKFPTLAEARAAGVFHPNCLCTLEYIDEDIEADEIKRQEEAGKVNWEDPDAVQARADEIAIEGMKADGMAEEEAKDALTRGKVEDAIRAGLFTDDAKALASSFTREQLAEFRKDGVPRFQFAKKGEHTGWRHGGAGGVVRIEEGDIGEQLRDIFTVDSGPRRGMSVKKEIATEHEPFSLPKSLPPSPALAQFMESAGIPHSDKPLDLAETNPGFLKEFGTHDNCTHCVVAGFIRLHGYDVVATPTGNGETYSAETYWKSTARLPLSPETLMADINDRMLEWGSGAIAQVRVSTSSTKMDGHVFLALARQEDVFLYDCQTGNSENCNISIMNAPTAGPYAKAWIMRLDNNELTEAALMCFRRSRKTDGNASGIKGQQEDVP